MSTDGPSVGDQVRHRVDRFLSWSPLARFLGLFGVSFLLVLGCAGLALVVMPPPGGNTTFDLPEAWWWSLSRVLDAGAMSGDSGFGVRGVATLATLGGVGVLALFIGLVSSTVGEKLNDLRRGKGPVLDQGHTLILGGGEQLFSLLRELVDANAGRPQASVVILSTTPQHVLEEAVRERVADLRTTRVVVREGSPCSVHHLRKVGAGRARSIVVLSDQALAHGDPAAADVGVITCLLALRRVPGVFQVNHVTVELQDPSRRAVLEQLGVGGVEVVAAGETLSRMMVQSARQPGLAQVYRDLLGVGGKTFSFRAFPELVGLTFGEAQWRLDRAVACGVRRVSAAGPATTTLNPPDSLVLGHGDELLVLADGDGAFSAGAHHQPQVADGFRGAPPVLRLPERLLVCGRSPRLADMLVEYDRYVLPGSEACLMPGVSREAFAPFLEATAARLGRLTLSWLEGDPTVPAAVARAAQGDFAAALVVADGSLSADQADARTVITLLLLREVFRGRGAKAPRLSAELLDPRTRDLLEQDSGGDFVVSTEVTSSLLAQVSERRELNGVFAELFDADGNELYLKRSACFTVPGRAGSWLGVQLVARRRGEVAVGYLRASGAPVLNPRQNEVLTLHEGDRVIVIAPDERELVGDEGARPGEWSGGVVLELAPPV